MGRPGQVLGLVLTGVLAALTVHYFNIAPDPSQGVRFYYVNSSGSNLVLLNLSTSNAASTSASTPSVPLSPPPSSAPGGLSALPLPPEGAPLAVIIHGYTEHAAVPWIRRLTAAFQHRYPGSTVLVVDYYHMTTISRPYMNINIQHTAQEVAGLLDQLVERRNFKLASVHVLCFSLGGRVAGGILPYLNTKQRIGRITGLDPAVPWQYSVPQLTRDHYLDDTDAETVVLMRTSTVGARNPAVLRDFTINGGFIQEGCYAWYKPQFIIDVCSHYRVHDYASEALLNAAAFPACPSLEGTVGTTAGTIAACAQHVHFMDDHVPVGRYHLNTSSTAPYSLPVT